jgi:hypothetical protein
MSSLDGPAAWHTAHGTRHTAHSTWADVRNATVRSRCRADYLGPTTWGRLLRGLVEVVDLDVDSSDAQLGEVGDGGDHVVADSIG